MQRRLGVVNSQASYRLIYCRRKARIQNCESSLSLSPYILGRQNSWLSISFLRWKRQIELYGAAPEVYIC